MGLSLKMGLGMDASLGGASKSAVVWVFLGDSNTRGQQADNQNLTYTADPLTKSFNGTSWVQYVPNVTAGYSGSPTNGFTGMDIISVDDHWGPEASAIQAFRAAHPTTPLFIFKNGDPGATASWVAAQNPLTSWDVTNGTLYGFFKSQLLAALAALPGYTITIQMFDINLGVNDMANTNNASACQAALTALIAKIRTDFPVTAGVTKYILNRPQDTGSGFGPTVRNGIVALKATSYDIFWINTDASAIIGGGNIHYTAAGLIANGNLIWGVYNGVETALVMTLGTNLIAWWDAGYGITTATGVSQWNDRLTEAAMTQSTGASQPTFSSSDYNGGPSLSSNGTKQMGPQALPSTLVLPVGSNPVWVLAAVQQDQAAGDAKSRSFFAYGNTGISPPSVDRRFSRLDVAGVNRGSVQTGIGGAATTITSDTLIDFSGKHVYVGKIGATTTSIDVDNDTPTSQAAVPATANPATYVELFSASGSQAWVGHVRDIIVTLPLNAAQEAAARTLLAAR